MEEGRGASPINSGRGEVKWFSGRFAAEVAASPPKWEKG